MALKSRVVNEFLNEEYNYEIPVSTIDIVFQLLLFFLAASKMKQPENKLDTLHDIGGINKDVPPPPLPPREYRIKIDGTDSANPIYIFDTMPVASIEDLVYKLKVIASSPSQCYVLIVGKPKTPFGYIVWALDACKQAQIENIRFEGFPVPGMGLPVERGS